MAGHQEFWRILKSKKTIYKCTQLMKLIRRLSTGSLSHKQGETLEYCLDKEQLGRSDHESVHLKILRRLAKGRIAIMQFKSAHLRLLGKPVGRRWSLHWREH